jgi:hypothetical protein
MDDATSYDEIEIGSDRGFGLVFAGVFLVIGLLPLFGGGGVRWWSVIVASGFVIVGVAIPSALQRLNRIWFSFGIVLGDLVSQIVMVAVFFLLLVPVGFFLRSSRRSNRSYIADPDPTVETYWVNRESSSMGSLRNQY